MRKSAEALSAACSIALLLLVAMRPAPAGAANANPPQVPPPAQLSRAEATIKKLFRVEYEHHAPADRQALARKLLAEGRATPDDAAARYVCYREARDLATLGGDLPTAFTAINAMAMDFAVDPREAQKMKAATFISVARQVDTPDANAALAELGLNLLARLVAAENFDDADRLLTPLEAAAGKTKLVALVTRVQTHRDEVIGLRRDAQKTLLASEMLKKAPDDPDANLTVGSHLAFVKGAWEQALPLLAKSSDPALKTLSRKELGKPADAKSQLQLADGWWAVAETKTGPAQTSLQKHAREGYQRVFPTLSVADAARVSQRLPPGTPSAGTPSQAPAVIPAATSTQPAVARGEVTKYWWVTNMRPPGRRVWVKTDAQTWQETDPMGAVKRFRVVSRDDPELGSGVVVQNLADPSLEVWVPKLVDGNLTYFRRSDAGNQWQAMGGVHVGDPPPATRPDAPTHP